RGGDCHGDRWPLAPYGCRSEAEQRLGARQPRRPADLARGPSLPAEIYARRKESALPDSDRKFERAVDRGSRVEPHRAVAARHSGRLFAGPIILEFGLRHFSGRPPSGFLLTRPRRKASVVA